MKDTPFEIISKSLGRIYPQDINDICDAANTILSDKANREVILGECWVDGFRTVVAISYITDTSIDLVLRIDNGGGGSYLQELTIERRLFEDMVELDRVKANYFLEKHNKELMKEITEKRRKEEEEYKTYIRLREKFEKDGRNKPWQ